MPIDDASQIAENRTAESRGELSTLAYRRVMDGIRRLVQDPSVKINDQHDSHLMKVAVGRDGRTVGFTFRTDSLWFVHYHGKGQHWIDEPFEITLNEQGCMRVVRNGDEFCMLDDVVANALQHVLA